MAGIILLFSATDDISSSLFGLFLDHPSPLFPLVSESESLGDAAPLPPPYMNSPVLGQICYDKCLKTLTLTRQTQTTRQRFLAKAALCAAVLICLTLLRLQSYAKILCLLTQRRRTSWG